MYTEDQKQASAKIGELTDQAYALIKEAQKLADEHGLSFSFSLGYGMGGYYYSKKAFMHEYDVTDEAEVESWLENETDDGWRASSRTC